MTMNGHQTAPDTPVTPPPGYQQANVGYQQAPPPESRWHRRDSATFIADPRRKHPLLAIVLSAMPGLGQIYVGYYQQGITLVIIAGALLTVTSESHNFGMRDFEPLLVMATIFTWLYSCVDAGRRASLYNQALSGLRPMDLPENQRTPEWHGSLVGGACLALFGMVLFFHTMFGMPMEWVTRWWPLALVLVGVWLVYASIQSRAGVSNTAAPPTDVDNLES